MSTKIANLTGPGTIAAARGIGGTDLGIARETPDGRVIYIFGDTFDQMTVGGPGWRSPVALMSNKPSSAQLDAGVQFTTAVHDNAQHPDPNYATQLLPYGHNVGGISTVLPTDAVTVGGGFMAMHVMVIGQGGLDDCMWTEMHGSTNNGQSWFHMGNGGVRGGDDSWGMFQMLTWEWDQATDWVYVMTSGGLRRNRGVLLWRVKGNAMFDKNAWQGWGWNGFDWGWDRPPSNIMPGNTTVGEMNLRKCQGQWLFTYFESSPNSRIVTRVLKSPTDNIGNAPMRTVVTNTSWQAEPWNPNNTVAQLYGGYLIPGSTLAKPHYVISQWDTINGDNWPYRSMQFRGNSLPSVNPITA